MYSYLVFLLVYALADLSSRLKGEVVDTIPGAATLEVVVVAPSRNPTNKLAITRSSRSNLLGKNVSIIARLPCLWQRKQNYPECTDSGCSRDRFSCERVQQGNYKPIEQIDFVGKGCGHRCETAVLVTEEETISSAMTLDVVAIAPHASSSNKLGINQSNGSILLGKDAGIAVRLSCSCQKKKLLRVQRLGM
jgi:hypothetical protein